MVNQNFAWWKPVPCKNDKGEYVAVRWAGSIDRAYKGELLNQMLTMPEKGPLSYEDAIRIFSNRAQEALKAKDYGMKPGQCAWYLHNFVEYISGLGYHIELTGDEIESCPIPEIRA